MKKVDTGHGADCNCADCRLGRSIREEVAPTISSEPKETQVRRPEKGKGMSLMKHPWLAAGAILGLVAAFTEIVTSGGAEPESMVILTSCLPSAFYFWVRFGKQGERQ